MTKHEYVDIRVPIEKDNPAILRNESMCIKCGKCKEVCTKQIGVAGYYDLAKTDNKAICVHCGQCANVCPTGAITQRNHYLSVAKEIANPDKTVVFMTSPSVRVALGEEFGMDAGSCVEGKMVAALKTLGGDYVFDTTFAADLTIMEEASELIERITNKKPLPQYTSCCPAWVRFAEMYYPEILPHISSSKSPISMFGPTIKTYFAKEENINPKNIITVALTPCTAKKAEILREEMSDASKYHQDESYPDVDYVITTRELGDWLKANNIDLSTLKEKEYDSLMPKGSGAGIIFGNTGGVMEAALRSAYYMLTGKQPPENLLSFSPVRGLEDVKSATIEINDITIKVAVIHGLASIRSFIASEEASTYHFVEVMTCRGGCIGGGGQPKPKMGQDLEDMRKKRIQGLYTMDETIALRNSHDNPNIQRLYKEFYATPLSTLAKKLLHTSYHVRDDLGEDPSKYHEIEKEDTSKGSLQYVCDICGFVYEGDITKEGSDYVCPICQAPKEVFSLKKEEIKQEKKVDSIRYTCTICGFVYEGDLEQEPDDYKCPICSVGKELFEKS